MNGMQDIWIGWLSNFFAYNYIIFALLATVFFFLAVFSEKNAKKFGIIAGGCAIWMMVSLVLISAGNVLWRFPSQELQIYQLGLSIVLIILAPFLIKFALDAKNKVEHKEAFYSGMLLVIIFIILGIYLLILPIAVLQGPQDLTSSDPDILRTILTPMFHLTFPYPIAHTTLILVALILFAIGAYVLKEMKTKKYESDNMQELDKYQKTLSKVDLEISRKIYHVLIVVLLVGYLFVGDIVLKAIFNFSFSLPLPYQLADNTVLMSIINSYILPSEVGQGRAGHLLILMALFWILIILLFTDAVRIKKYRYYPIKMLAKVYRDKERAVLAPHVYLTAGCLFVVFLSDAIDNFLGVSSTISAQIVIITVMISALSDAVATIIGVTKGKHHLKGGKSKKTWEGLLGGFVSAILLGMLSYVALMSQYGGTLLQGFIFSLIAATVFTLIDYFSPPIPLSDNILNPITISLVLWGVWFIFYY